MKVTKYIVSYRDLVAGIERARTFNDIKPALAFIELRADQPEMYNEFHIEVVKWDSR